MCLCVSWSLVFIVVNLVPEASPQGFKLRINVADAVAIAIVMRF